MGETEVNAIPTEGFTVRRFDQATLHQKTSDHAVLTTSPIPSTLPVLVTIGATTGIAVPGVPSLPDWVPLPSRRTKSLDHRDHPLELPITGGSALGYSTTWERVERSLVQRDFIGAETLIERLSNKTTRATMRLQCVRALMAAAENPRACKRPANSSVPNLVRAKIIMPSKFSASRPKTAVL